jgi:uncharacterized membrane protein
VSALRTGLRFLLAHHFEADLDRCVRLGPVPVCARCLALYPVLLATFAMNFLLAAPRELAIDPLWIFLPPWPAYVDWAAGRYDPRSGTNARRLVTGAFAGLGLGRLLYVLSLWPSDGRPILLLALLTTACLVTEVKARRYREEIGP